MLHSYALHGLCYIYHKVVVQKLLTMVGVGFLTHLTPNQRHWSSIEGKHILPQLPPDEIMSAAT